MDPGTVIPWGHTTHQFYADLTLPDRMAHQFCNLITDIPGLRIGSAEDASAATGVTVILPDRPVTAAADVRGGGPGTRDIDALSLSSTVDEIHALVLSGGSGLGLGAATGSKPGWRNAG